MKDKTLTGYTTIISAMARESSANEYTKNDLLTQCLIVQWFDYAVLFIDPAVKHKTYTDIVLLVCSPFLLEFMAILASMTEQKKFHVFYLQELNNHLAQRSYLVGQGLTLADVVVFYSISAIMESLQPSDKEKYLNVSRWYDHIQKIGEVRQNVPMINVSTIYLHGWATGTHM